MRVAVCQVPDIRNDIRAALRVVRDEAILAEAEKRISCCSPSVFAGLFYEQGVGH